MKVVISVSWIALLLVLFASPAVAGEVGKKIFEEYECVGCHMVSAYGMSVVQMEEEEDDDWGDEEDVIEPPDLSDVGLKRDAPFMANYLRKRVDIEGRKHKKRFKGSKEELKQLVLWLTTLRKKPISNQNQE